MPISQATTRLASLAERSAGVSTIGVVGGGPTGCALATTLQTDGRTVKFLDESGPAVERAKARDIDAVQGDPIERADLAAIDPGSLDVAVVAEQTDKRTALSAQLLRTAFDCPEVVALLTDPDNLEAIEAMDLHVVTALDVLAREIEPIIEAIGVEREGERA